MSMSQKAATRVMKSDSKPSFGFGDPEPEDKSSSRKRKRPNMLGINVDGKRKKKQ